MAKHGASSSPAATSSSASGTSSSTTSSPISSVTAVAELFADDPPRFLARTPHGYHDRDAVVTELRSAGFANVAAETLTRRSVAPSPREPAIGFCQGTPLRSEIEARDANRLAEATEAAAGKIAARFGNGPVDGKIQAHIFTASD